MTNYGNDYNKKLHDDIEFEGRKTLAMMINDLINLQHNFGQLKQLQTDRKNDHTKYAHLLHSYVMPHRPLHTMYFSLYISPLEELIKLLNDPKEPTQTLAAVILDCLSIYQQCDKIELDDNVQDGLNQYIRAVVLGDIGKQIIVSFPEKLTTTTLKTKLAQVFEDNHYVATDSDLLNLVVNDLIKNLIQLSQETHNPAVVKNCISLFFCRRLNNLILNIENQHLDQQDTADKLAWIKEFVKHDKLTWFDRMMWMQAQQVDWLVPFNNTDQTFVTTFHIVESIRHTASLEKTRKDLIHNKFWGIQIVEYPISHIIDQEHSQKHLINLIDTTITDDDLKETLKTELTKLTTEETQVVFKNIVVLFQTQGLLSYDDEYLIPPHGSCLKHNLTQDLEKY